MQDLFGDNEDVATLVDEAVAAAVGEDEDEFAALEREVTQDAAQVDFITLAWRKVEEVQMYRELGEDFTEERRAAQRWLQAQGLTPAKVRKLKPRPKTLFD